MNGELTMGVPDSCVDAHTTLRNRNFGIRAYETENGPAIFRLKEEVDQLGQNSFNPNAVHIRRTSSCRKPL